jgi:hypothetical protein
MGDPVSSGAGLSAGGVRYCDSRLVSCLPVLVQMSAWTNVSSVYPVYDNQTLCTIL